MPITREHVSGSRRVFVPPVISPPARVTQLVTTQVPSMICRVRQSPSRWGAPRTSSREQGLGDGRLPETGLRPYGGGRGWIELRTDQSTSPEGLVVGRSSRLSHMQIRDGLAFRQNLPPRLVNAAVWVKDLSSTRGKLVQRHSHAPPTRKTWRGLGGTDSKFTSSEQHFPPAYW